MEQRPLALDDVLYFSSINWNGYQNDFWEKTYNETGPGGKFAIDLARRLNPNRYVTRDESIWTTPWPQEIIPKYKKEKYDASFNLSFEEVSDRKAFEFAERIRTKGERFAMMYSGGIDSTTMVVALLKNLSAEELKNVSICTSIPALVENPVFWQQHIYGKFEVIDSMTHKYSDLIERGYTPVTADDGDCIFGTVFGIGLYHNWESVANKAGMTDAQKSHIRNNIHRFNDPDVHYTTFKDLLSVYFKVPAGQKFPIVGLENPDPKFGRRLYDKFALNAQTADVPVNSLHDFFWWLIFNVKMLNCGVRGALYYNDIIEPNRAIHAVENWYNDPLYQHWSMTNNNNGEKIGHSAATYKKAARDYIYSFDKNPWYRSFKLKLESMALNVVRQEVDTNLPNGRPAARFGITKDYELLNIDRPDVQNYIRHHLNNFQIDWSE